METRTQIYPDSRKLKFSILVPSWNNLPYLKLCIAAILKNSSFEHQLIVHVNGGNDGTLEWVREQKIDHSYSAENVGVCHALNAAAALSNTDYIVFLNDDMYVLPNWDQVFVDEIGSIGHDRWFLSGTMVEPGETGNLCAIQGVDMGRSADDFREEELLRKDSELMKEDWSGATWPPNVVPRMLWEEVGGYSVEFSPGISSDPDFSMKLWQAGVRYFKGLGKSRAYHFQAKSTGKVVRNPGKEQFLKKWGITQGTFGRHFLRRGKPWSGAQKEPSGIAYKIDLLRSRIKK